MCTARLPQGYLKVTSRLINKEENTCLQGASKKSPTHTANLSPPSREGSGVGLCLALTDSLEEEDSR